MSRSPWGAISYPPILSASHLLGTQIICSSGPWGSLCAPSLTRYGHRVPQLIQKQCSHSGLPPSCDILEALGIPCRIQPQWPQTHTALTRSATCRPFPSPQAGAQGRQGGGLQVQHPHSHPLVFCRGDKRSDRKMPGGQGHQLLLTTRHPMVQRVPEAAAAAPDACCVACRTLWSGP